MSVPEAFAQALSPGLGSTVVYVSQLPAKPTSADGQWTVIANGGARPTGGNVLLWRQPWSLLVHYRHRSGKAVYDADAALRTAAKAVTTLQGVPVLALTVNPLSDTDLDPEGRHTASWQVEFDTIIN